MVLIGGSAVDKVLQGMLFEGYWKWYDVDHSYDRVIDPDGVTEDEMHEVKKIAYLNMRHGIQI